VERVVDPPDVPEHVREARRDRDQALPRLDAYRRLREERLQALERPGQGLDGEVGGAVRLLHERHLLQDLGALHERLRRQVLLRQAVEILERLLPRRLQDLRLADRLELPVEIAEHEADQPVRLLARGVGPLARAAHAHDVLPAGDDAEDEEDHAGEERRPPLPGLAHVLALAAVDLGEEAVPLGAAGHPLGLDTRELQVALRQGELRVPGERLLPHLRRARCLGPDGARPLERVEALREGAVRGRIRQARRRLVDERRRLALLRRAGQVGAQALEELGSRRGPLAALAGERAPAELDELTGSALALDGHADADRGAAERRLRVGLVLERRPPRQHAVERPSQEEDVGPRPDLRGARARLLGSHEGHRTARARRRLAGREAPGRVEPALRGARLVPHQREPPVHQEDLAELAHHHLPGLDVAMDDAARVGERHGLGHGGENRDVVREVLVRRERAALLGEQLLPAAPLHQLHRERRAVLVLDQVVDRRDVRMVERGEEERLLHEAAPQVPLRVGIPGEALQESGAGLLRGDDAMERRLRRQPHLAEAALPEEALPLEARTGRARGRDAAAGDLPGAVRLVEPAEARPIEVERLVDVRREIRRDGRIRAGGCRGVVGVGDVSG
jgi:hypothetical protein